MTILAPRATMLTTAVLISACTQPAGEISRDAQPFDGISEEARISLLGAEPFWGIDINPEGGGFRARYSTPDNIDGESFTVDRFAGNNGLGFSGELGGEAVQIALSPADCSDTMSDRTYPYAATVSVGDTMLMGCAYTSEEPFTGEETP